MSTATAPRSTESDRTRFQKQCSDRQARRLQVAGTSGAGRGGGLLSATLRGSPRCDVVRGETVNRPATSTGRKEDDRMKNLNYFLSIAAGAVTLYATSSMQADEPLLSPRAKAHQSPLLKSPVKQDPDLLANRPKGNARGWQVLQSIRTIPYTGPEIDLAHAQPNFSPKDPRFEAAQRENAAQKFQVALVK
jgi:hypothetical protein